MTRPDNLNVGAARTSIVHEQLDGLFAAGLASLQAEDFAAAESALLDALAQAESISDPQSQLVALVHLIAICRRQQRLDEARSLIGYGLDVAGAALPSVHSGAMYGHYAWLAWRDDNTIVVREYTAISMGLWQSADDPYPHQWIALWPLVAAVMDQGFVQEAIGYAQRLLGEGQQRMPEPVERMLLNAFQAWDSGDLFRSRDQLQCALALAQEHGFV